MIGIVIAMDIELKFLADNLIEAEKIFYKSKTFYKGKLEGKDVILSLSEVGKVNAAYTTLLLLEHFKCDYIINTGVSGGLGKLKTLDAVLAEKVCQHDMDSSVLGDPLGFITGVEKIYFDCDKRVIEAVKNKNIMKTGILACGDQFIADDGKAIKISEIFDAVACDMESGAVGHICEMYGIPFTVIRTISDDAQNGSDMLFEEFCPLACKLNAENLKTILNLI